MMRLNISVSTFNFVIISDGVSTLAAEDRPEVFLFFTNKKIHKDFSVLKVLKVLKASEVDPGSNLHSPTKRCIASCAGTAWSRRGAPASKAS